MKLVVVAYSGCGCVTWYARREYMSASPSGDCSRCGKPSSGIAATEVRVVEESQAHLEARFGGVA